MGVTIAKIEKKTGLTSAVALRVFGKTVDDGLDGLLEHLLGPGVGHGPGRGWRRPLAARLHDDVERRRMTRRGPH